MASIWLGILKFGFDLVISGIIDWGIKMGLKFTLSKFSMLEELRKINNKFYPCIAGQLDFKLDKLMRLINIANPAYKDIQFLRMEIKTIESRYHFYDERIKTDVVLLSESLPEIAEEFGRIVWQIEENIFEHLKQSQEQNIITLQDFRQSKEYLNFKQRFSSIIDDYDNLLQMFPEKLKKDIKVTILPPLPEFN